MTDHLEEAAKLSRMFSGTAAAWFQLALFGAQSLSTLAVAADSAARTYAAVHGRPGAPRAPRG